MSERTKELYLERNYLLHKATSYKGIDDLDTMRVRTQCFIEADQLTDAIEREWATNMTAPPFKLNLYTRREHRPTHFLQSSDGVTARYKRINDWDENNVDIIPLDPVARLRYFEDTFSEEEQEFRDSIHRLRNALPPTAY